MITPLRLAWLWCLVVLAFAIDRRPRPPSRRLPSPVRVAEQRRPSRTTNVRHSVAALPPFVRRRLRRAVARSERELADVIDLFSLAAGSGLNLRLALAAVASRSPPAWVEPLAAAHARVDRGVGVADALDRLPAAVGDHAHPLVSVLVSSERYGTALLPALERLAIEARFDRRRRAEEAARRVPVKLLFPLVLCILPAFGALTVAPLLAGALGSLRLG
jgi:pilus assembly protein TadC